MALTDSDIYTLEAGAWNGVTQETLRFTANGPNGYTTGGGDTPANTNYKSRLSRALMVARHAFAERTTDGRSPPGVGEVELWNEDGVLDKYRRYSFNGRPAIMRRGLAVNAYPSAWSKILDGTMHEAEWDRDRIRVRVRDAQKYAQVEYQTTAYLGTGGLEGTADLKGKKKPVAFGSCFNVPAILIDPIKLIFQVNDGSIASATVKDKGLAFKTGFTFAAQTTPFTNAANSEIFNGIAYGAGTWIAIGAGNNAGARYPLIATSTNNGVTWTSRTAALPASFATIPINCVAYGGGTWVIGAGIWGTGPGRVAISTNAGVTWTEKTLTNWTNEEVRGAAYSSTLGMFCICGKNGKIATAATAGLTWTTQTSGSSSLLSSIVFARGLFVIAGNSSGILTSLDGVTWTPRTTQFANADYLTVTYGATYGFVASGYDPVASGSDNIVAISVDGITWERRNNFYGTGAALGLAEYDGTLLLGYGNVLASSNDGRTASTNSTIFSAGNGFVWGMSADNSIVIVVGQHTSNGAGVWTVSTGTTYANTTDLQDDNLKPQAGRCIVCPSAGMFRLGSRPAGTITSDVLQGANAAARTGGQFFVFTLGRAGQVSGDWSASDVTTMDTQNPAVIGFWAGPNDLRLLCGEVLDKIATTLGAAWFADGAGVLRLKRLDDPSQNLVANPSLIAGASWTGTGTYTNNYRNYDGINFCRMQGDGSTNFRYQLLGALTGTQSRIVSFKVHHNGTTGQDVMLFYDGTANTTRAGVLMTFNANGTITFAVFGAGTGLTTVQLVDGSYHVRITSAACVSGNQHYLYASDVSGALGSGGVTDWLLAEIEVYDAAATASFSDTDIWEALAPMASGDENDGIPPYKFVLRWGHNFSVQSSDLATTVTDSDRIALAQEWRETDSTSAASLAANPLSQPRVIETLYTTQADAQTEATRRKTLHCGDDQAAGHREHKWYEFGVLATTATAALEIFDTIDLAHWRFNFGTGTRVRIMGIKPEARPGNVTVITFTIWT